MLGRWLLAVSLLIAASSVAPAQSPPAAAAPSSQASQSRTALVPISNAPRRSLASVSSGAATLPHEDGQVWREYDLTHYTKSVTSTRRPEQAIVDWILRETGYEAWHTQPFGILSASADALYVYHTPEMHATVAEIVDRFVRSAAEPHAFGLRVVSMGNPNWRSRSLSMMRALPVQTQGVQAWLMQREDVALLLAEMAKRTDYREHGSPHMIVENGQSAVVSQRRRI